MSHDRYTIEPVGKTIALRLLGASALRSAFINCAEKLHSLTGIGFDMHWGTSGAVNKRMADGEVFDLVAGAQEALAQLRIAGKLKGEILSLGASQLALGIRASETAPDISSVQKFHDVLINANMIARGDPAGGGTAGNHLVKVFAQLGVTELVVSKSILRAGGFAVMKEVADGNADFGLTQSTEIPAVEGVKIGAFLPAEVQLETIYAIAAGLHASAATAEVITYLGSKDAQAIIAGAGFAPA